MADANRKWLETPRSDEATLLDALKAYSSDCQILINSEHPALAADHERWLKKKCGDWKIKIDDVVAALENKEMRFDDALKATTKIVETLINKLKTGPTAEDLRQAA